MTTSDYLKTQADLLIAHNLVARLRLEEFLRFARELASSGSPLCDLSGQPVSTDPAQMAAIGEAAKDLVRAAARVSVAIARREVGSAGNAERARSAVA